ncbi:carboxylesterase family protein [Mycolicibacterium sp. 018/SC-01/001]|nr:carboxylesterase/lipase family protein [Mycolicibacterium sp. 018/SC-01/001]TRW81840.1 carboxylesterase family protein [Mycolicibacterium sp. 018/SC-01/001]
MLAGCVRSDGQSAPAASPPPDPAVVQTTSGTVRGVVAPDHRLFADLPYAAPPVGPLRFADPQPPAPWPGVREATAFGPRCMQSLDGDIELGRQTDEDCLSLNVWTPPVQPSAQPRAVMVWIHGGAFVNGSGRIYDARRLAARGDIIVVTLNYRLGALGFLAHPALGPPGQVGNYGLADQQAALRWVRDNIAAFGGDPDRVTVAGESAGGMSVCDHLVSPGSRGLFSAAIIQSGPCTAQAALPVAQDRSLAYAADHGCPDPATAARCLRELPADRLRDPVWFYGIGDDQLSGPVTGSAALPADPVAAIGGPDAQRVPVLIGTTRDEFTLFVGLQYLREGKRYAPADYPRLLTTAFGPNARAVEERYPLSSYPDVPLAYSAAVTDAVFSCVGDRLARAVRDDPVYFYEFDDRAAPAPEPLKTLPFPVGASHSLELRYLFDVGPGLPLTPAQQKLADQMIDYWASFVKTQTPNESPNTDGQPQWDEFGDGNRVMSLRTDGSRMSGDFRATHQCDFWDGLP